MKDERNDKRHLPGADESRDVAENMLSDTQKARAQLEREMAGVQFTEAMKRQVLQEARRSFWEREVYIPPAVLAGAIGMLVILVVVIFIPQSANPVPTATAGPNLVVLNSGVFYEEQIEEGRSRP